MLSDSLSVVPVHRAQLSVSLSITDFINDDLPTSACPIILYFAVVPFSDGVASGLAIGTASAIASNSWPTPEHAGQR